MKHRERKIMHEIVLAWVFNILKERKLTLTLVLITKHISSGLKLLNNSNEENKMSRRNKTTWLITWSRDCPSEKHRKPRSIKRNC